MTSPIIPNLDPTKLVFSDNGNIAELTGPRRIFVDRDRFKRAIKSGDIGGGAILLTPNTDTTVGQLKAIYIGYDSHTGFDWIAWRRGNEPLEKFLKRADKLDAYYDTITAFRNEDSENAEGWAPMSLTDN